MKVIVYASVLLCFLNGYSQVGIGTTNPDTSSILDISATNAGVLIPRLTDVQRSAITNPANGLLVYQTNEETGFWYYNSIMWVHLKGQGEFVSNNGVVRNTTNINGDSFVFGSTQMNDLAGIEDNNRMLFDKTTGAFRAGMASGIEWDTAQRGDYSVAFGLNTIASGIASNALGRNTTASGHHTTAWGLGTYARSASETAFGTFNTDYTPGNPFDDRLLSIGNGTSNANRSDALTILKNGRISIGNATPHASSILDINASNAGVLMPRLTQTQRAAITNPANGLLVYQTDNNIGFWYYNGAAWTHLRPQSEFVSDNGVVRNTTNINGDSFVFGSTQMNNLAGTQDDNRMFFDKTTGSFRAGRVTGTQWDTAERGSNSVAFGINTIASATNSTAFGFQARAWGDTATAFGYQTNASGSGATAFGYQTNASGVYATAWGESTTASINLATAWGRFSTALGIASTAFGYQTNASGLFATAWGQNTTASATNSTAFGIQTTASGVNSTAWGMSVNASANNATAWGSATLALSYSETAFGTFNTIYIPTSISAISSNDRLLSIGNGVSDANRSDALTILKSGKISIGNATPHASSILDINATNAGVLMPRLTQTQRTAITNPANGLLVYQTDSNIGFWYYNGTAWTHLRPQGEFVSDNGVVRNTTNINGDSFVFGSTQMNNLAGTQDDNRMFFDKTTGAFRAGRVLGTHWDTAQRGSNSVAFGFNNTASATYATAWGENTTASGNVSTAWGRETYARSYLETALGVFNTNYTPDNPLNFSSNDRLLSIGNGTSNANRSDALTILKNGKISIGNATPHASSILDINATNAGVLMPRLTQTQRAAITNPANGLLVYQTDNNIGFWYYSGTAWMHLRPQGEFVSDNGIVRNTTNVNGDSFVFGSTQMNDIAGTQDDNRMFFDKTAGAFRAGTTSGLYWDTTLRGDYSTAFGLNSTASGNTSTALGAYTTASGTYSTAWGENTTASGNVSTAFGYQTTASGVYATAWGENTTASGNVSTAWGRETYARSYLETALGVFNTNYTPDNPLNFSANDRLLSIGNGTSDANRSDALTILKNGNVGITTATPNVKLHITGGTDASLVNGSGYLVLGNVNALNIVVDDNEIMARNNGSTSALYLNNDGGAVYVGGQLVQTSDERLKKDITNLPYGLKEILQLQPKTYHWKNREQTQKSLGLIAQEVQPIIKEIVHQKDDENKSLAVNYIELIPVLINAVKQQQVLINDKDAIIKELKATIEHQQTNQQTLEQRTQLLESKFMVLEAKLSQQ